MSEENKLETEFEKLKAKVKIAKGINHFFDEARQLVVRGVKLDPDFDMDKYSYFADLIYDEYGDPNDDDATLPEGATKEEFKKLMAELDELNIDGHIYSIVRAVGWSSSSLRC